MCLCLNACAVCACVDVVCVWCLWEQGFGANSSWMQHVKKEEKELTYRLAMLVDRKHTQKTGYWP